MAPHFRTSPYTPDNPSVGLLFLMPTVLRVGGFSVRIYSSSREHGPPHVHVVRAGAEVIILLGDSEHMPAIRAIKHMRSADISAAYEIVVKHQWLLLQLWRHFHG